MKKINTLAYKQNVMESLVKWINILQSYKNKAVQTAK